MDKFAFWTLKVLSYVFIASAVASFILGMNELDDGHASAWTIWLSGFLTSLFFSATSHVLSRVIERIYSTGTEEEIEYGDDENI